LDKISQQKARHLVKYSKFVQYLNLVGCVLFFFNQSNYRVCFKTSNQVSIVPYLRLPAFLMIIGINFSIGE
jgi:hypothetical protein